MVSVDPRETRMAVLEDGRLVELRIERDTVEVGSIYKGRIERVLPGMDAAFVDIGLDRNAFMHVSDFADAEADAIEEIEEKRKASRGKHQQGGRAPSRSRWKDHLPPITEVAREGQELLVQVARAPLGSKGARATTRISLAGRYVVLLPVGSAHVGVSRKIESDRARGRLKELATQVKPRGHGLIVRTEGQDCDLEDLQSDVEHLRKLWRRIRDAYRKKPAPALLHEELSLVERTIRDLYSDETREIVIDSEAEYQSARRALAAISPEAAKRCVRYKRDTPLFEKYGVEAEIERALRRRVPLPSGGNITIDENEALSTIDVNTGSFVGTDNLADTIVKTNLESAREIARQLRLRDIGGIIVLDFIDMSSHDHRRKVVDTLERELGLDKARTRLSPMSHLGLIEMTRKRTSQSLLQNLCQSCPTCEGRGRVMSPDTVASRIERELLRRARGSRPEAVLVTASFDVAWELIGPLGRDAEEAEERIGAKLYVRCDPLAQHSTFDVRQGSVAEIERDRHPFKAGQMYHCRPRVVHPLTGGTYMVAEVDGYIVVLQGAESRRPGLVTVELLEAARSVGRGRVVE